MCMQSISHDHSPYCFTEFLLSYKTSQYTGVRMRNTRSHTFILSLSGDHVFSISENTIRYSQHHSVAKKHTLSLYKFVYTNESLELQYPLLCLPSAARRWLVISPIRVYTYRLRCCYWSICITPMAPNLAHSCVYVSVSLLLLVHLHHTDGS